MSLGWIVIGLTGLIGRIHSELVVEQFASPDFSNSNDWTFMVNDHHEYFCNQNWCGLPDDWGLAPDQNVILFNHPDNFLASCFQMINISALNSPEVTLRLRILPENQNVWPAINFTWNNLEYPFDLTVLNSSSDDYQELFLNGFETDIPGKIAGVQIQTNNRILLISRLSLRSVISDNSFNSDSSEKSSDDFVLSTSDIIALFIIGFFGIGIIVMIVLVVIHYGRKNRQSKNPDHILFHDQL